MIVRVLRFKKEVDIDIFEDSAREYIHTYIHTYIYIYMWGSKTKAHDRGPGTPFH